MKRLLLACSLALVSAAALAQPVPAPSSTLRAADLHIANIAHRLASAGSPLCTRRAPLTGMLLHYLPEYDAAGRQRMTGTGLSSGPGVLAVVEGSAAARAGLQAGDVLLAINGEPAPDSNAMLAQKRERRWRSLANAWEARLQTALEAGPVELRVLRQGAEIPIRLEAPPACPSDIRLARSDELNAVTEGRKIVITTALQDFTETDDELAVAIAHEMAHLALRHAEQLKAAGVPEGRARRRREHAQRIIATEQEADRLALRIAARAGYDIGAAIPFWRRLYAERGRMRFTTHPDLAAREALVREMLADLSPAARAQ